MSDKLTRARAQMRERFLAGAAERLITLGNVLLAIEATPTDLGLGDQLMREIHTLKGEAKLMQLADINAVAHDTEEVILAAQREGFARSLHAVEHILVGFDALRRLVEHAQDGDGPSGLDLDALQERLQGAARMMADRESVAAGAEPSSATADGGKVPRAEPSEGARQAPAPHADWLFRSAAHMRIDPRRLDELSQVSAQLLLNQKGLERAVHSLTRRIEGLSRELEHAETILQQVGEPTQARREHLAQAVAGLTPLIRETAARRRALGQDLRSARDRLFESTVAQDELQLRLRDLRLQPVGALFERFPRAVRDLALSQGKKIRVEVSDANVAVDKRVLERLSEPLLHVIRNAVDHGIEGADERLKSGKPETASIRLVAEQGANSIAISVEDDGRGIDMEAVRRRAVELGMVSAESAASLTSGQILAFVLRPGFTTRDTATDLSGRGVGLDAVTRALAELSGSLHIQSELGRGTRCVLTVPGTLLLKPVLMIRLGAQEVGIASQHVERVVDLSPETVTDVGTGRALWLDGARVPLGCLASILNVKGDAQDETTALVVRTSGRSVAFAVDTVLGQAQVLERPVGAFMAGSSLIEGVAITEAGKAVLLLSVARLIALQGAGRGVGRGDRVTKREKRASVLVVDDSEVTRELVSSILRHEGFDVIEAINGRDALDRLRANRPSLVLSDLEMPILDGIELLTEIRASPQFGNIPFIMFTTRASEADRRRGAQAGASAYLVKGNFDEQELLSIVRKFVNLEETT